MTNLGTREFDNLLAGNQQPIGREIVVLSGQSLAAGSVIGKVTASGKYVLSLSAASDGSEVPDAVLPDAVDATAGDVTSLAWVSAVVNEEELTYGTGHTADSTREGLRVKGVHVVSGAVKKD